MIFFNQSDSKNKSLHFTRNIFNNGVFFSTRFQFLEKRNIYFYSFSREILK